jgi:ABC-type transport system involved in multi-copper enzyme maturation permease subunit
MRLGWLIGLLILSFILLISYFLTLYIFLPIFGEKVEDIYLFNKYIIALFIPHYIFIFIFIISYYGGIEENKLDWFFVG